MSISPEMIEIIEDVKKVMAERDEALERVKELEGALEYIADEFVEVPYVVKVAREALET